MVSKTILHYHIIENVGEARLYFGSVGQGGLALRDPLIITEAHNDR